MLASGCLTDATYLKAVFVIDHGRLYSQQCPHHQALYIAEQLISGIDTCRFVDDKVALLTESR